jgi:hypothetical protein
MATATLLDHLGLAETAKLSGARSNAGAPHASTVLELLEGQVGGGGAVVPGDQGQLHEYGAASPARRRVVGDPARQRPAHPSPPSGSMAVPSAVVVLL